MSATLPAQNTPQATIWHAYYNCSKIGIGQEPSSEQYAIGMSRLVNLVNLRQAEGLRLWLQSDLPIQPIAGVNLYTLGPTGTVPMTRPTRVLEAYYTDQNNTNRPLIVLSRNEWDTLSTFGINSPGTINQYFTDKQIATLNVYFWLTPDAQAATGKVHLIIQQQQPLPVSLVDTMVLGPEWFLYLQWHLAWELSQGQPIAVQQKCQMHAQLYKEVVDNFDYEDAGTMFAPDPRMFSPYGRFK